MEVTDSRYKSTGKYVLRFVAGGYVLLPSGETLMDDDKGPLLIDDVTAFIIKIILKKPASKTAILSAIHEEYNVGDEQAEKTLEAMLDFLLFKNVIRVENGKY